jgi:hypothetical protein
VFNTSGIDLWYRREGAVSTDITEADLASPALTDAHADGGFLHINDGWYRLDLPDAACAAGVTGVQIGGTVTDMVVLAPYIELVAYNPYDTVRLGLTALPNANADAAGGLPISDAGGLDLDGLDTNVSAILVDTAEIGTATDTNIATDIANVQTAVDGLNDISAADVLTTQMTESYAANGTAPTLAQAMFAVHQYLMEFAISGTSYTVKQLGGTNAFVVTLDDADSPTAASRD